MYVPIDNIHFLIKLQGPWDGSSIPTVEMPFPRRQEAKLLTEVNMYRERLPKCLFIVWRMSDSEFGGKEIIYPWSLSGSLKSFPDFFGEGSLLWWAVGKSTPGRPAGLSHSRLHLEHSREVQAVPAWWPGPKLCGKEYSSAQTFQLLLKPNGTSLSPGPHPLPLSVCCFAIATKSPSFMFPLLASLQSAPSPTPLL